MAENFAHRPPNREKRCFSHFFLHLCLMFGRERTKNKVSVYVFKIR